MARHSTDVQGAPRGALTEDAAEARRKTTAPAREISEPVTHATVRLAPHCLSRQVEERQLVHRTSYGPTCVTPEEAVANLERLGYDFYLFTDRETGQDAVVYRAAPTGYRLTEIVPPAESWLPPAVPLTVSEQPAPQLGTHDAIERLSLTSEPFLFFADAHSGRGHVVYRRRDGHYGLVTPEGATKPAGRRRHTVRHALERMIVVGIDGDDSLAAVDVAATEAERRGLPLRLLSAHPTQGSAGPHPTLAAILQRVCATWPGLAVATRNVAAEPSAALIAASRAAALVVVGRGHDDGPRPDSAGALVAAHALCPTLVVPSETPVPSGAPVLLGLGMSPEDEPAIAFAFEEAAVRRVPLLAMYVWSGVPATAVGAVSPFAYDPDQARSTADRMMAEALAGWADKYPDVTVDRVPVYGVNPAQALLDASATAGLIVMGARRHGLRSIQLLGTVTSTLIREARCPVAVVRPTHLVGPGSL